MILRDRYGYPVETIFGKPVTNLIRRILHTNIRRTLAGKPLNEEEIAMKIKPTQFNVALAHSAFAGKTIYGDAAFPSVQTELAHPGLGSAALREGDWVWVKGEIIGKTATGEYHQMVPVAAGFDVLRGGLYRSVVFLMAMTYALAACGAWQVRQWLIFGLEKLQTRLRERSAPQKEG